MKTHCKQCDQGGPVNDKGLCLPCAVKTNAERRKPSPLSERQQEAVRGIGKQEGQ